MSHSHVQIAKNKDLSAKGSPFQKMQTCALSYFPSFFYKLHILKPYS